MDNQRKRFDSNPVTICRAFPILGILASLFFCCLLESQEPAISPNLNQAIGNSGSWAWGMQFVPSQDLVVTELGWFDRFGDGFSNGPHPVGIYRVSDQVQIASLVIDNDSTLENGFRYESLFNPVTLEINVQYLVVGHDPAGSGDSVLSNLDYENIMSHPKIVVEGTRDQNNVPGLVFPNGSLDTTPSSWRMGANFKLVVSEQYIWTGGSPVGGEFYFNLASNWSENTIPSEFDTAQFLFADQIVSWSDAFGGSTTTNELLINNSDVTFRSLGSDLHEHRVNGRAVIDGSSLVVGDANMRMELDIQGMLQIDDSTLTIHSESRLIASRMIVDGVVGTSSVILLGGTLDSRNDVVIEPGDELNISGSGEWCFDYIDWENWLRANLSQGVQVDGDINIIEDSITSDIVSGLSTPADLSSANLENFATLIGDVAIATPLSEVNNFGIMLTDGPTGLFNFDATVSNRTGAVIDCDGNFTTTKTLSNRGSATFNGSLNATTILNQNIPGAEIEINGTAIISSFMINTDSGVITISGIAGVFDYLLNSGEINLSDPGAILSVFGQWYGTGDYTGPGILELLGPTNPGPGENPQGSGQAVVNIEGDLYYGATSINTFELAGSSIGQFDRLQIGGDLQIFDDAQLMVEIDDGFTLLPDTEFEIISVVGNSLGQFAGIEEGSVVATTDSVDLRISYLGGDGNDIVLNTCPTGLLLGDINRDCIVNLLDVAPFVDRISNGTFQAEADVNEDGVVNLLDVDPFIALLSGG